jgi:hypothetical protein
VLAVLAGTLTVAVGPAGAQSRSSDRAGDRSAAAVAGSTCEPVEVSFRGVHRGGVYGCYTSHVDSVGPYVSGYFGVCDDEDEPQETNIVRGEVVVAFSNGSSWEYVSSGWKSAPGDGAGCRWFDPFLWDGPHASGWTARYLKITAEAPGKATVVERPGL